MRRVRTKPQMRRATDVCIDFLYLDLTDCPRCRGTDKNLRVALKMLEPVLTAMGIKAQVRKTQVKSEPQARTLGFVSSPTLRVNGRDIAARIRESLCESCSAACQCGSAINCRVWDYRGQQDTKAPVGLIVESILREALRAGTVPAPKARKARTVAANLKRYFAGQTSVCGASPSTTERAYGHHRN
jgi:hypothetical protein